MSDGKGKGDSSLAQGMPITAQPGTTSRGGLNGAIDFLLGTRKIETMGNHLLTGTLNGATANHVPSGA
jgi:hypothetical protein